MSKHAYLMESENEADRLIAKSDLESTEDQLRLTGLLEISTTATIADIGCGIGIVGTAMTRVLTPVKPKTTLILVDGNKDRLHEAATRTKAAGVLPVSTVNCAVEAIDLPDNHCDYVFSRFLFEYLQNPKAAFKEILRVTKPGGKIVIGDLDNNSLSHYPLEPKLENQLVELTQALNKLSLFDPLAGRKIFKLFAEQKLVDIKVNLLAHHLFYGPLPERDYINWKMKLDQLKIFQKQGKLKLSFPLEEFGTAFLEFLQEPTRFSYTPLILVAGRKPK